MSEASLSAQFSDGFWSIIEAADMSDDKLVAALADLSKEEIREFYRQFRLASAELKTEEFTVHLDDSSEDNLADIAEYVVSKGKGYFDHIGRHPGEMPSSVDITSVPTFRGTTMIEFQERFGEDI